MSEDIITRQSSEFKELRRNIIRAIQAVDILIDTHRPAIGNEVYLTSEEVCSLFGLSKRSLQNYRDNCQIPYTSIGGKILYPLGEPLRQSAQKTNGRDLRPPARSCLRIR